MNRIPFDAYDFFGYLASGLLVVLGMDLSLGFPRVLGQDLTIVESAALLIAVYVAGQIMANPAKAILEDGLIGNVLGRPNVNLFRGKKPWLGGLLFPGFYSPLPEQTREKILGKAEGEGIKGTGENLFLHVRYSPVILQDQRMMDRLNSFLNKYGFSRNLAFSALVVGLGMLVAARVSPDAHPELTKYGITSALVGISLFYRYLKFFRQYSYELFNIYGRAK